MGRIFCSRFDVDGNDIVFGTVPGGAFYEGTVKGMAVSLNIQRKLKVYCSDKDRDLTGTIVDFTASRIAVRVEGATRNKWLTPEKLFQLNYERGLPPQSVRNLY